MQHLEEKKCVSCFQENCFYKPGTTVNKCICSCHSHTESTDWQVEFPVEFVAKVLTFSKVSEFGSDASHLTKELKAFIRYTKQESYEAGLQELKAEIEGSKKVDCEASVCGHWHGDDNGYNEGLSDVLTLISKRMK